MKKKYSPLKSIRKRCIDCAGFSLEEVRNCSCFKDDGAIEKCALHLYRMGKRPKGYSGKRAVRKAIRTYCLWCCSGNRKYVKECVDPDCFLYSYRLGIYTASKNGVLSEKTKV